jgi:hypothetical protein
MGKSVWRRRCRYGGADALRDALAIRPIWSRCGSASSTPMRRLRQFGPDELFKIIDAAAGTPMLLEAA